jgi:hypothetical protein
MRGPEWWVSGKEGSLAPWAQAKAWALMTVSKTKRLELSDGDIAEQVTKVGGGHPTKQGIAKLRANIEADPSWHPGKVSESAKKRGPKAKLTDQKKKAIARSAMALKASGVEPSVAGVVEKCPALTLNPATQEAFTDKYILEVFRSHCFDPGSTVCWDHDNPLSKTALPDFLQAARNTWGKAIKDMGLTPAWLVQHCVFLDPCNTILPGSQRTAFDHAQAGYGKSKRWLSKDKKSWARNQRAAPYAGKQEHWGDRRVWWFVVVARGRVRLVPMEHGWQQNGDGMAVFVEKLDRLLGALVGTGGKKPRCVFTDRGPGFYQGSSGGIVLKYKDALDAKGFRSFAGDNSKWQPPDIPDLLPHETAVAWVRAYFRKHPQPRVGSLDAKEAAFRRILADAERHINAEYDVTGLASGFLGRVEELLQKKGARLGR